MKELNWTHDDSQPVVKIPLLFSFPPVEALMKELTKLNSPHIQRISYLGPRWSDSLSFHKKYSPQAYPFNDRNIAKNSAIFSQSMMHNQFYKNQIFYRAFEGMNPTLNLTQQIIFQSRFEGGNLDCAVKVSDTQYDLFLRIDSNTRGNIYWFYFAIKNCPKDKKIRLNICNLTKTDTHYSTGLNPFSSSSTHPSWTQDRIQNTTFKQKKLRYKFLYDKMNIRRFYQLSFEIQMKGQPEIRFAYCIPYTYSDLMQDIKAISSVAQVGSLGQSLTGVNIPMLMIGKQDENVDKQVLLITGRVHPGESNSSIMLSSFMKFLCFSQEARFLRQKVITIIIPMLNPDGVILGNSRCGASGKDLNRQFKTKSKFIFPEVINLKNLVDKISQTYDIEMYLDFHGHSRKKNMFLFGPDYNITQPQYYKSRAFPKILSGITNIFRYYSCSYTISNDKKSTARAVMLNQMMIPQVFTVEASLGFYHDYYLHKKMAFTKKKWQELGQCIALALKEYFQGIQQYELFLEAKRKAKNQLAEDIRQTVQNSTPQPPLQKRALPRQNSLRGSKQTKDIKIFKIFDDIKQMEEKRSKDEKVDKNTPSEDESDSHNSQQQFQKQKMKQFSSMVTDCVEEQTKRKTNSYNESVRGIIKKNDNFSKKNRLQMKKRRQLKMKEELIIFSEHVYEDNKIKSKRKEIKTENKQRVPRKQDIFEPREKRNIVSDKISKISPLFNNQLKQRQQILVTHSFLDEDIGFIPYEKKSNKMNIRMFNFSKSGHSRFPQHRQIRIIKKPSILESQDYSKSLQIEYPTNRPGNIQQQRDEYEGRKSRQDSNKRSLNQQGRYSKEKGLYPASFYRIKYHNSQRKRQQSKREHQFYDFQQYQESRSLRRRLPNHNSTKKVENDLNIEEKDSQRDRLFAKLRRLSHQ